ncbi:cell division ATP-binding protein FtsE [Campylobacter blaseri]|uniref:ABC transporter ATP-binding protein n=1 Tax=Campylobacter blaseri TaxID=2042961 RepID=A0A2P8R022_9BACT|nr:ATP-binding cassette domain-containing protein [Campylobacter blaseri]PSM51851.1 ABC transporter ATP-binding protein [Campylobacter blaseri]PSM53642.1 ABC transporter ATP-binding protein [Campylobacter blaseri]QKF86457.1 cell division ATP-binding protein FtsE [Campylobacter blaseri]
MEQIINAKNLTLGYEGEKNPVIKNASFSINKNDFIVITGKSGSGKSTLLKSFYGGIGILNGELDVCFTNLKNINNRNLKELRQKIGIVFQDYKLVNDWTIEKNVMLPLEIDSQSKTICKKRSEHFLKYVKLGHKIGKYPLELSGGEQQRVAVARAIVHEPNLLLCDEPTGNLDEVSSNMVWDFLRAARDSWGTCVVVVTHRAPSTLKFNFRHFEIKERKVVERF